MSASNQIETIDAYLRGELSPIEMTSFEAQLQSDPALAQEFAFQKSVVNGIQESRKLELKSRLSELDVTGVAGGFAPAGALKIVGGVLLVSVLGVLTFQLSTQDNSPFITEYGPYAEEQLHENIEVQLPEVSGQNEIEPATKETLTPPILAEVDEIEVTTPMEHASDVVDAEEEKIIPFNPVVDLPEDDGDVNGKEFEPEELTETFDTSVDTKAIDALNIERLDEDSKKLRYRYYDGKLALFGDFGESPYQILEINQKDGGKEVFLLHNETFYGLELTKEEQPLQPIEDPALLRELQIFLGKK